MTKIIGAFLLTGLTVAFGATRAQAETSRGSSRGLVVQRTAGAPGQINTRLPGGLQDTMLGAGDGTAIGPQSSEPAIGQQGSGTAIGPESDEPAMGQQGSGTAIAPQGGEPAIGPQGSDTALSPPASEPALSQQGSGTMTGPLGIIVDSEGNQFIVAGPGPGPGFQGTGTGTAIVQPGSGLIASPPGVGPRPGAPARAEDTGRR